MNRNGQIQNFWQSFRQNLRNVIRTLAVVILMLGFLGCPDPPDDPPGPSSGPVNLTQIDVKPKDPFVLVETTKQLEAVGRFSNNSSGSLISASWDSLDSTVASVDSKGIVTGVKAGTTTIIATDRSITGKISIRVRDLRSISITPQSKTISTGAQQQFTAIGHFSDGPENITSLVTWSTAPAGIAIISSAGMATGVAFGTSTITANLQGTLGITTLTVFSPNLISIEVTPSKSVIIKGGKQQFTATGHYNGGFTQDITKDVVWESSVSFAATISSTGSSTGLATGASTFTSAITSEITAKLGTTSSNKVGLMVLPKAITSLSVDPLVASIAKKTKQKYQAFGRFMETEPPVEITSFVDWESDLKDIADIDSYGVAIANSPGGPVTINATFDLCGTPLTGCSATASLTVTDASLIKLSITPHPASVPIGLTQQFIATGTFKDNVTNATSTQDLGLSATWSSSNGTSSNIGRDDGLAKGLSLGTSTIKAMVDFSSITGSATLEVINVVLESIKMIPTNQIIPMGSIKQFKVIGILSNGSERELTSAEVTWQSDNGNVVGFTSPGVAVGIQVGSTKIKAFSQTSAETMMAETDVEVVQVELDAITVSPTNCNVPVGITCQYTATGVYNNGFTQDITDTVTWASLNTDNATITQPGGLATAKRITSTSTIITAKLVAKEGMAFLSGNNETLTSIDVAPANKTIGITTTLRYTAKANYASASYDITALSQWSSSATSTATIILDGGIVTATAGSTAGTSTIMAHFGTSTGTTMLTVKNSPLKAIKVTPIDASISLGKVQQFMAEGIFGIGTTTDFMQEMTSLVDWGSSSPPPTNVTTISNLPPSKGQASSLRAGSSSISAEYKGLIGTTTLTVTPAAPDHLFLGKNHTCARLSNGLMRCWGANFSGQLGNSTTDNTEFPSPSTGGGKSGIKVMATGVSHTCSALDNGALYCWGLNTNGQLGDGTTKDSKVPVRVSRVLGATQMVAGESHTCAIFQNGSLKCWGGNGFGQLGEGGTTDTNTPVNVNLFPDQITAGSFHTCALVGRSIQCWGDNQFGQLGVGVGVGAITTATAVSAGDAHTCALLVGGGVVCSGNNNFGQLGVATTTTAFSFTPVPVPLGEMATAISANGSHTCAVLTNETVKCWGRNDSGELGNNTVNSSFTPVTVSGTVPDLVLLGVRKIVSGGSHTCAILLVDNKLKCWGLNTFGQLGVNYQPISPNPIPVPGMASLTTLGTGGAYTCGTSTSANGAVLCFGSNGKGQLGNGTTNATSSPVSVSAMSGATAVTAGDAHACAIVSSGNQIKCWGYNGYGGLGNGTLGSSTSTPTDVTGIITGATAVSAGGNHTCAIVSGGVLCWGEGSSGKLGRGGIDESNANSPVSAFGLTSNMTKISAGPVHTCALSTVSGGSVYCWGSNGFGQLGGGSVGGSSSTPNLVSGLGSVTSIAVGSNHTCALLSGAVWCWGNNGTGQLGDGGDIIEEGSSATPVNVAGLFGVTAITAGSTHTCALLSAGTVKCWGHNSTGQLGSGLALDGSLPGNSSTPVDVIEGDGSSIPLSNVIAISAGGTNTGLSAGKSHTCAIILGGTMKCWGDGSSGQIGSALKIIKKTPVDGPSF